LAQFPVAFTGESFRGACTIPMRVRGIIRLFILAGLSLGLCTCAMSPEAHVYAETQGSSGLALLTRAAKAYDAGAYTDALATIEEAFKAGLDNELAARAILLRAQSEEKSGQLARALSDYSSALWMQNLPSSEKPKAAAGKERVMAAMGLNSPSDRPQTASAAASNASAQAAQGSSSGGIFGVFGGLFGSSKDTPPPKAGEAQTSWQTSTTATIDATAADEPKPARAKRKVQAAATAATIQPVATAKHAPQPAKEAASTAGGYHIDFGAANSKAAAATKAQQIKAKLADILVHRELLVQADAEGAFRIIAGPYKAQSAANALCSEVKRRGVHCEVTQ
jgi:cell division septation protein DedD